MGGVRVVGAVGAAGAEGVWAHIGSLFFLLRHLGGGGGGGGDGRKGLGTHWKPF